MASVIKAAEGCSDVPGIQGVAFNFDDMTTQANRYLDKVRAEATQIVARAQKDAKSARVQAEAEGRRAGQAAVEQTIKQQLAQQMTTLLPALQQAVQDIRNAKQAWLTHWEKAAVHVAAVIARRVIRRELSRQPEISLALVREALELAAGSSQLRILLNPADHAALRPQVEVLAKELAPVGSVELVADPQITLGGCRVETQFGTIDQQVETQLARIEEELT